MYASKTSTFRTQRFLIGNIFRISNRTLVPNETFLLLLPKISASTLGRRRSIVAEAKTVGSIPKKNEEREILRPRVAHFRRWSCVRNTSSKGSRQPNGAKWREGRRPAGRVGARSVGGGREDRTAGATSGAASWGPKCIALCVALLSKMASSSELLEYSSPVKRRKVDGGGGHGNISAALADPQPGETPRDSPHDDLEGIGIPPYARARGRARKYHEIRGCLARKMAAVGRLSRPFRAFRVSSFRPRGRHDSRDRSRRDSA